ncbi:hypothetical protein FKM82_009905 [Ascaphus truei]
MLAFRNEALIKQAAVLCRLMGQRQLPSSNSGALTQSSTRHYRSKPTHGIGRYKHLLPPEAPPKKKEKPTSKEIKASSDSAYGTVNLEVSGYDMTLVEHYSQYVHNLCNRLSIKVEESYAKPTITKEVLLLQEQGTKMFVDAVLTTHERVIQVEWGGAHYELGNALRVPLHKFLKRRFALLDSNIHFALVVFGTAHITLLNIVLLLSLPFFTPRCHISELEDAGDGRKNIFNCLISRIFLFVDESEQKLLHHGINITLKQGSQTESSTGTYRTAFTDIPASAQVAQSVAQHSISIKAGL